MLGVIIIYSNEGSFTGILLLVTVPYNPGSDPARKNESWTAVSPKDRNIGSLSNNGSPP